MPTDPKIPNPEPLSRESRHEPNATTLEAIAELEAGKGKKVHSVEELMADLNAPDHD